MQNKFPLFTSDTSTDIHTPTIKDEIATPLKKLGARIYRANIPGKSV
jgi:hypothetical protein